MNYSYERLEHIASIEDLYAFRLSSTYGRREIDYLGIFGYTYYPHHHSAYSYFSRIGETTSEGVKLRNFSAYNIEY